jgi:putative ABC transport system substrate-binding protein
MSYGESLEDTYPCAATFVDKIVKGARLGDRPIEHLMRFALIINRRTADTLGLTISKEIYVLADEVIE